MPTARPIYRRDVILGMRDRWLKQYAHYGDSDTVGWERKRTAGDIRHALAELDLETCSPADVDAALSVTGWAKNECDECDGDFPVVVRIGEEPGYEARWQDLCPACLQALARFVDDLPPKS